jgi:hypothetical protein
VFGVNFEVNFGLKLTLKKTKNRKIISMGNMFARIDQESLIYSVLLLLLNKLALGVGELDIELGSAEDDLFSGLGTQIVGEFTSVDSIVHEEEFEFLDVSDQELLEAVGQEELGLPGLAVAALDQGLVAAVLSADAVIDTSGTAPAGAELSVEILVLESGETLGALEDFLVLHERSDGHL